MTRFYLSANSAVDAGDVPLGGRPVPALVPGASNSGSVTLVIPPQTPAGKYFIVAAADGDGVVVEALENNNTKARNVTVTAP
jgi:subtilase family serine protease